MNLINNVILFFKKLFNKDNNVQMIEAPVETLPKEDKDNFINSLKVNMVQESNKNKVETLTCFGDGLGIQTKISG